MRRSEFLALASSAAAFPMPGVSRTSLDAYMAPHVTMAEFRGVVALAPRGRLQSIAPFAGDFDGNTRFRVASVAKTFTAATTDAVIRTGTLSLDTKLGSLLKPFAASAVTIEHLLDHSSGIPDIYSLSEFALGHRNPISKNDYVSLLASKKPDFPPGTNSAYSNSGYSLLAFALEAATGKAFADLQRSYVLDPLGLRDTGVLPGADVVRGADPGSPDATRPPEPLDPSWLIGNGSLYSTANDSLRWMAAIREGAVVRTRTWPYPWGWGQDKTKTILEGDGRYAGYACRLEIDLQTGDAVAVLSAVQSAVVNTIANGLMNSITGAPLVPANVRTFVELQPSLSQEYAGRYSLSPGFVLEVRPFGNAIQVASADGVFEALDPLGEDRFYFRVLDTALVFKRSPGGEIAAIDWGPGAFTLKRIS